MPGKNIPRAKKRCRDEYIRMLKDHKTGKAPLIALMRRSVTDRIAVLDGLFPKEILYTEPRPIRQLAAPTVEELDFDAEVQKLRDKKQKEREESDGHSHSDGSASPRL